MHADVFTYIHTCVYVSLSLPLSLSLYIYIYIYVCVCECDIFSLFSFRIHRLVSCQQVMTVVSTPSNRKKNLVTKSLCFLAFTVK